MYKTLLSLGLLLTITVTCSNAQIDLTMGEALLRFFEEFRCRMFYDQADIGLPKLEPLETAELALDLSDMLGDLQLEARNVRVEGLSEFYISDLDFDYFTLDFWMRIELPKLVASGWYSVNGDLDDMMVLTGSGDFRMEVDGINLFLAGTIWHEGFTNTWAMPRFSMDFNVTRTTGYLQGIQDDEVVEAFFKHIIDEVGAELTNLMFPEIEPMIAEYAKAMTPNLLNGTPLLDLINIIFLDVPFLPDLPEDAVCEYEPRWPVEPPAKN